MTNHSLFKRFSTGLLTLWLMFFAFLPFLLVIGGSFLKQGDQTFFNWQMTFENYRNLFHPVYLHIFLRSFYFAAIKAFFCLLLGYPFAYILSRIKKNIRMVLMFLFIVPFWTSSLIRVYSIIIIVRANGLLNHVLMRFGLIHHPIQILYTKLAVMIGLIYTLLPFMILPLYANMEKFDWRLIDAAQDLGASKWQTMRKVVFPITMPGIVAGIMLVVLPAMTMFFIPDILGGARSLLLGNLIKDQFIEAHNWPMGSAVSVMLTIIMGVMLLVYWKITINKERRELI